MKKPIKNISNDPYKQDYEYGYNTAIKDMTDWMVWKLEQAKNSPCMFENCNVCEAFDQIISELKEEK